ncbi:hypothetical protein NDU88_000252 [Pleurodeles waltl]|uniref:Uncharacterized protein n=1 Tax=Pleurodeles waltl TaxID=8319 RepID=A0AAV7PZN8_PLEWA|nr:hypothetical protein NDU88_000252 [Pleurodeles waltl]
MSALHEDYRGEDALNVIKDLEQRLRNQIDKLEHLRLSVGEALSSGSSSTGFDFIQQNSADLRTSLLEHQDWLGDLNERLEAVQLNTALFLQMNTKPRPQEQRHRLRDVLYLVKRRIS